MGEKITKWYYERKNEIIVGIVASTISAVIIKGVDFVKLFIPTAGGHISDLFFYNLSRQTGTNELVLIIGLLLGFYSGVLLYAFLQLKRISVRKNSDKEEMKNIGEEISIKKIEGRSTEKKTVNIRDKKVLLFVIISLIVYLLWVSIFDLVPAIMWREYRLDVISITPYTDEAEVKKIESDWVNMKNKDDYDKIYSFINKVKEENDLI